MGSYIQQIAKTSEKIVILPLANALGAACLVGGKKNRKETLGLAYICDDGSSFGTG